MLSKRQSKRLQARIAALPNELNDNVLDKLLEFDHLDEVEVTKFKPPLAFYLSRLTRSKYAPHFFANTKFVIHFDDLQTWFIYGLADWHRETIKRVGVLWIDKQRDRRLDLMTGMAGVSAIEWMEGIRDDFVDMLKTEKTDEERELVEAVKGDKYEGILMKKGEYWDLNLDMRWSFGFCDVTADETLKWTEEVEVKKVCL
ncbi:hypothetical protein BST61_g1411 [Cercospora zeina]